MSISRSSHFDDAGQPRMVDVSAKPTSTRTAVAESWVKLTSATYELIRSGVSAKGDILAVARLAAIGATKQTAMLIPLCHAIPVEGVEVDFELAGESDLRCVVKVMTTARTGVEMEALTAASVAALAVYDMCKSVDRGMQIGPIRLLEKTGGKTGDFLAVPSGPLSSAGDCG